jgi:type II secretory pathway component PulC
MSYQSKIRLSVVYGVTVIFGLIIANFIFGYLTHSTSLSINPERAKRVERLISSYGHYHQELPVALEIPAAKQELPITKQKLPELPAKEKRAVLVLNGIFFAKDGCYALINNRIVKENDVIEGATVMRITVDEVELEADAVKFKLSTTNTKSGY